MAPPASGGTVTAALVGLAAAWIAAGSLGLIVQPLRNGLLWVAIGAMLVAAWPKGRRPWGQWMLLATAVAAGVVLAVPTAPVYAVLGIALVAAVLARLHAAADRQVLLLVAMAATVLGMLRLAMVSVASVWSAANALGHGLGRLVAAITGKPLEIGATFSGLDLLLVMAVIYAGWLRWTAPPRRARALYGAVAIVAVEVGYLLLLAWSTNLESMLPDAPAPPRDAYSEFYCPPDWHWSQALAAALPWNVPVVAGLANLVIVGLMFRRSRWISDGRQRSTVVVNGRRPQPLAEILPALLALLLPVVVALAPHETGLGQRTIVAYDRGYLDWEKPTHGAYGQQSAGVFGMLPQFMEALGGRFVHSAELAEGDLRDADVLVLLRPNREWPPEQLERVWQYVRDGGSLLVVAGPGAQADQIARSVNEVLKPCTMKVRADTAFCPIPYWQYSLDVWAHPATAGIDDRHNRFGLQFGGSIRVGWPGQPLLVGRYGWGDRGTGDSLDKDFQYKTGEPLGDVVLAAEQALGRGTVVVLADSYGLTNEGSANSFAMTGQLLSYLARRPGNPQAGWRQALGIVIGGLLIGLMFWRFDPSQVALVAIAMSASLAIVHSANGGPQSVLPDGRDMRPNPVAYIDASHLGAFSGEDWTFDGLAGLKLTLMRNGYLPLMAPDLRPERLERASLLVSIAPARAFSEFERATIRRFVDEGGIFISMVGAPAAGPSEAMLDEFGFRVPRATLPAVVGDQPPHYERHFCTRYLDAQTTGSHDCYVWFNAAWPIECNGSDTTIIARDFDDRPILAMRRFGQGMVVVVGDTGFAMNKNLEYVGGEPFEGGHENAHFWRWLLTYLNGGPSWIPPPPPAGAEATKPAAADGTAPQAKTGEHQEGSP